MKKNNKYVLPSNHKRVVSVTARLLERELNEIENLIKNNSGNITRKINRTLTDEQRDKIKNLIEQSRSENEKMFHNFNLEAEKLNEHQIIYSKVSYLITILTDSTSKGLKGYGKLDKELAHTLDESIKGLIDNFTAMESILTGKPSAS